mgnify:FL=1
MIEHGSIGTTVDYRDLVGLAETAQDGQVLLNLSEGHYNQSEFIVSRSRDDTSGSPGSPYLLKGTLEEGFFGFVDSKDLFNGNEIAQACAVTQGTVQFSDIRWIKLAYKGKVLFRPQKSIRHSISWDHLNQKGVVMGTKTVSKNNTNYKVRLHKGALTNPSENEAEDRGAKGSEWNRIILPLSNEAAGKTWGYPQYVEDNIPNWGTNLTNDDLNVVSSSGNGYIVWCQETPKQYASNRILRGYGGVSNSDWFTSSHTYSSLGWVPVLEVI